MSEVGTRTLQLQDRRHGILALGAGRRYRESTARSSWICFGGLQLDPVMLAFVSCIFLTLVRLLVAANVPLSEDEAYYWLWSIKPAFGYFDHPPMVAWLIWASTALLGRSELAVRLPVILSGLVVAFSLYRTTISLFRDRRIAATVVLWANATLLVNVGSVMITPDTPLCVFWCLAILCLARLTETNDPKWWLAFGVAVGCALLSKYTAVLIAPVTGLWLLSTARGRRWLIKPEPYLGAIIAAIIFVPVIAWNANHDWISFAKQWGHAQSSTTDHPFSSLGAYLGSQASLITPVIFAFCIWGSCAALRRGVAGNDAAWALLGTTFLPLLVYFAIHALGHKVQANWPAFIFFPALIAAVAAWQVSFVGATVTHRRTSRLLFASAPIVGFALSAILFLQLTTGMFPIPARLDPTRRLVAWDRFGTEVGARQSANGATFLMTTEYALTGELSYYVPGGRVLEACERHRYSGGLGPTQDDLIGQTGLYVVNHRKIGMDVARANFDSFEPVGTLQRRDRSGAMIETYDLYLGRGYHKGPAPWKC